MADNWLTSGNPDVTATTPEFPVVNPVPVAPVAPAPVVATPTPNAADLIAQVVQGGPNAELPLNVARQNDNGAATNNQVLLDRHTLSPYDFLNKYGPGVVDNVNTLDAANADLVVKQNIRRTSNEKSTDFLRDVNQGLASGVGGVAVLGAGIVGNITGQYKLGTAAAQLLTDYQKHVTSTQTPQLQKDLTIQSIRGDLDKQDNNAEFDKNVETDGKTIANLKYIAKDAVNSVTRLADDPEQVGSLTAQGVGSVLAAGPVTKGLAALGTAVTKTVGVAAVEGSVPVSIGLMEGGGAFQQTAQQVMDTSHDDLMKNSPEYRQLISDGKSQDDAKAQIASEAGTTAAAIQGPIAALTGKLVEPFEAHPFAKVGLKTATQNVGKEGVEELLQSGSGQFAQNLGIQQHADENQSLGEDVVDQAIQGSVAGALSAGAIEGPTLAAHAPAAAVGAAINAVVNRGANIQAATNAASPTSAQNVGANLNTAQTNAPNVAASILANNNTPAAQELADKVSNANVITPEAKATLPEHLQQPTDNKADTLLALSKVAIDENAPAQDKLSAALFIKSQLDDALNTKEKAFNVTGDLDEQTSTDVHTHLNTITDLASVKELQDAVKSIDTTQAFEADPITDNNVSTPESLQTINNIAGLATVKPSAVNPEIANQIIAQNVKGNINLTTEQLKSIQAANALNEVANDQTGSPDTDSSVDQNQNNLDRVSNEIETSGGIPDYQMSLEQHVQGINQAVTSGDNAVAKSRLANLNKFAQHMANKAQAVAKSFANNGAPEPFKALGADHKWLRPDAQRDHKGAIGNSAEYVNRVIKDASLVTNLANNMNTIYSELGSKPLPVVQTEPVSVKETTTNAPETEDSTPSVESEAKQEQENKAPKSSATKEEVAPRATEPKVEEVTKPTETAVEEPMTKDEESSTKTEEAPSESTKSPTIEESFPNLVAVKNKAGQIKNYFKEAFKYPKNRTSRLNTLENPIKDISNLLDVPADLVKFMDNKDVSYDVSRDNLDSFQSYLAIGSNVVNSINQRLTQLFKTEQDKTGRTLEDILNNPKFDKNGNPEEVTRFIRGRALNLLEVAGKSYEYNQQLMQTAVIAGLHWALNATSQFSSLNKAEVADLLDVSEGQLSDEDVVEFNRGSALSSAKQELGEMITKFWGVQTKSNVANAYTKGISEGVAAEVLKGLEAQGIVSIQPFEGNEVTFNRILFDSRAQDLNKLIYEGIRGTKTLLGDIALVEKDNSSISIGSKITEVAKKQMRNPLVDNTKAQRKALGKLQDTEFLPNMLVHDFIKAIGESAFITLMGGDPDYQSKELNAQHKASVEGKTRTLKYSYNNVLNQMNQLFAHAKKNGLDPTKIATYYPYNMSRVGRAQSTGLNNPQSDKLAREIFMPTRSVLDMTNESDIAKFWMTVGQGLGFKTEKLFRADVQAQAEALFAEGGKYQEVMTGLLDWLQDTSKPIPDLLVQEIKATGDKDGGDISMHGIHGLISVAKLLNAKVNGENLTKFEHFNYLEADGKTNGPIMSLMLFATGEFTPDWIRDVNRGGIFIGSKNTTLNQHYSEDNGSNGNATDLYKKIADIMAIKQSSFVKGLNPEVSEQYQKLAGLISSLNKDIQFKDGEIVIQRGFTKNPLTISIYGSGIDGIAAKVANELMDAMYEKMSDGIDPLEEYNADSLFNQQPKIDFKSKEISLVEPTGSNATKRTGLKDFKFTEAEFNALKGNVRVLLVNQMSDAIAEGVLNKVSAATKVVQQATQFQSIVLTAMFKNAIIEKLADKAFNPEQFPDYREGDFLSDEEQSDILKGLMKFSPLIHTDTQTFFLSGSQKSNLTKHTNDNDKVVSTYPVTRDGVTKNVGVPNNFSRSLSDDLSSPTYVYGPTLAGVKAVPSLNIGNGDGEMILQYILGSDAINHSLAVFDGINLAADKIDEYGKRANEAVHKAIFKNPLQNVADSFREFMEANPIGTFENGQIRAQDKFLIAEMTKLISPKIAYGLNENDIEKVTADDFIPIKIFMENLSKDIDGVAQNISERQAKLSNFAISIDQMASAEAPFTQDGQELTDASAETISAVLNAAPITPAIREAVETNSIKNGPVRVTTIDGLRSFIKEASPDQAEVMSDTLDNLKDAGYKVVFGSVEDLNDYQLDNHPEFYDPSGVSYAGKVIPSIKTIFIANATPETVLHELIHAATFQKVAEYYENPGNLSEEDANAIERIEELMNDFVGLNNNIKDDPTKDAFYMATDGTNGVDSLLAQGRDAEALNEFMAWGLSNQNLINLGKSTKITNPFVRIASDALQALKTLIFGSKKVSVGEDLFSNLRFNTQILLSAPTNTETMMTDISNVAMYQSPAFGSNDYLSDLRNRFSQRFAALINSAPTDTDILNMPANTEQERANVHHADSKNQTVIKDQVYQAFRDAHELAELFIDKGFHMNAQEKSTFRAIQATLMTGAELNSNSLSAMQEQYSYVMKNITTESFMRDPASTNPNDRQEAQAKYDALIGNLGVKTDTYGRSSLMGSFMALAMTNPEFRQILSKIRPEGAPKSSREGIDGTLENLGNQAIDRLSTYLSGNTRNGPNVLTAIDALKDTMTEVVGNDMTVVEQTTKGYADKFDSILNRAINTISDKVYGKATAVVANATNPVVKAFAGGVAIASGIVNETKSSIIQQGFTAKFNEMSGFYSLREITAEVIGRTESNKMIFDMISKVRAAVQQVRQMFRDDVPNSINKQFTRVLTEQEKTDLHKLAKTDIAALKSGYSLDNINSLITNSNSLDNEIKNVEDIIKAMDSRRFAAMQTKAKQLANYMNTGIQGENLLRNAYAVAHMFGEAQITRRNRSAPLVPYMDHLISMYALKGLDQSTKDSLVNLVNTEKEGVNFAISYLIGARTDELAKISNDPAKINHYKGNIPSEQQLGTSMIIADTAEEARLVSMGYRNVGSYAGSPNEVRSGQRAYYYNSVTGRATFNQGVLQTVHQTVSGVDPRTGRSTGLTAGYITDRTRIAQILSRQARTNTENLMPVYDDLGKVVALERGVDPAKLGAMNNNTDLPAMIGAWMGRQFEERLAKQYNTELVDNLKSLWDKAKADRTTNQFIALDKSLDPIEQDAWRVIPNDIKDYIKNSFGVEGFRIRRDMVNDAVGYRSASVGDLWSGNTRWKPVVAENIKNASIGIFGKDAYAKLVKAENIYQNVISDAKTLIVVKSVIVPMANIASNAFQLINRGVPYRTVLKGMLKKTDDLNFYIKERNREINLQGDLFAAKGKNDNVAIRKLETELQTIRDGYKRMSIYPLIEAGEYSVVSDGGVTQEDLAIANGKFAGYLEDIANRVPEGVKTPVRYALITKDTALFQGLARAVQYGDFLAKAIYYDHLTGTMKMTPEEALGKISEEYVNFNRLPGRTRGYVESMGLIWFWNYKIKNIKIGLDMLRNNPFRSLMHIAMAPTLPIVGSIGSPVTDNFASILADGKLGWSMGLGMGLNAPTLNPWVNILK